MSRKSPMKKSNRFPTLEEEKKARRRVRVRSKKELRTTPTPLKTILRNRLRSNIRDKGLLVQLSSLPSDKVKMRRRGLKVRLRKTTSSER